MKLTAIASILRVMMKKLKPFLIALLLLAFFLPFFAFKKEETQPLPEALIVLEAPGRMEIGAKALPPGEIPPGLANEADKQGYKVVTLTIVNQSPDQFELNSEWVDLHLADQKAMMRKIRLSSVPRSIFMKIAGIFFWPVMIPDMINTMVTLHKNHSLRDRLYAVSLKKEGEIVLPYSAVHRYLFLTPEETKESFAVEMLNCHTQKYEKYNVEIA